MITKKMISDGIRDGIIVFIPDPNLGFGTVAKIRDSWFYFGGEEAESMQPDEYVRVTPLDDIVDEIYETLDSFKGEFQDEYDFYEYFLIYGN